MKELVLLKELATKAVSPRSKMKVIVGDPADIFDPFMDPDEGTSYDWPAFQFTLEELSSHFPHVKTRRDFSRNIRDIDFNETVVDLLLSGGMGKSLGRINVVNEDPESGIDGLEVPEGFDEIILPLD